MFKTERKEKRRDLILLRAFFLPAILLICSSCSVKNEKPAQVCGFRVVNVYPHDAKAFTQGLFFDGGFLYEGTGLKEASSLRKVDLATGAVVKTRSLEGKYFGEGITICGDNIIQLTWQSNTGFVYDKNTFDLLRTFQYPGEGWGITYDGSRLIMSDGTSRLRFRDPVTFSETGGVNVRANGKPVENINELEYVRGEIYANIWKSDYIARIDPRTGDVTGWLDLTGLLKPEDRGLLTDVLNGIAYDPAGNRLFVTGKMWPKIFEIEIVPPGSQ